MNILRLTDLQASDERVRRFTSLGLSMGGLLTAEAAAEHQQRTIASAELVGAVPGGTRASFERLRILHSYGILCYDAFTTVVDLAPIVADLALRERFLAFYGNDVPVVERNGNEWLLTVTSVGHLVETLREEGLRLRDWPPNERFVGGFGQLLRWARGHDLLSGQRARHTERLLQWWRNRLAHPDAHHLVMPVDSARDIHDLAEIINRLWGSRTPGGRLYPAPIRREILALAIEPEGGASVGLASALQNDSSLAHATVLLVRGVRDDEGLLEFDAQYEHTQFPVELLWGPGTHQGALDWLAQEDPQPDTVDYLDRWFVIRRDAARHEAPRHPAVAVGLPESQRGGQWRLVRADFPSDAFIHVRFEHDPFMGPCPSCATEGIAEGTLADLLTVLHEHGVDMTPGTASEARMPGRWQ